MLCYFYKFLNYLASFFVSESVTEETRFFDAREKIYDDYITKKTVCELDDICSYIQDKKNIHIEKCKAL
jgi:hypothetical protein